MPNTSRNRRRISYVSHILSQKLEMMVAKAEADERDQVMTTTECIFSGSGLHILFAYACRHGACSVTPQQENALRSIAVRLILKSKKARQQFPDKNVDDICRSVLKKHRETVTLMGFTPTHLSLAIGMLNGVFKER
ncbi:ybl17 [Escherichia coli]|uniref:Ybl17 n=1 Tax=Escherichia coli TaxID=562 RepID=A0A2X3KFW1_ECOLX|nr:ybl17 [Escherichia coli]